MLLAAGAPNRPPPVVAGFAPKLKAIEMVDRSCVRIGGNMQECVDGGQGLSLFISGAARGAVKVGLAGKTT